MMKQDFIEIETPDLKGVLSTKVLDLAMSSGSFKEALSKTQYPEYLHWTKIKFRSWIPEGVSAKEFWAVIKLLRRNGSTLPIRDTKNKYFTWQKLSHYDKQLHELDLNTGGRLKDSNSISEEEKKSFISRGILEEAIASAQLEGAHTTREYAKKMIEEGRSPQNQGQKMIMNNYQTMTLIEDEIKSQPLSLELLFDLHKRLTEGTLDKPDQVGRFRKNSEDVVVASNEGKIAYIAPPIEFVNKEILRLIDYANDKLEDKDLGFLHPVVKAISLHFWIGFLHPFADGNGRLARALFYWYLLRKGYWAFAFIPVSTKIKLSPMQYARAYIYSEQDDNDLTYFIDYNLRKIELAKRDFIKYIDKKAEENVDVKKLSGKFPDMNHRQLSLIRYFKACPRERTNVTAMTKIYGVSELTAIKDLRAMVDLELLTKSRLGKNVFYYPTSKLLN